MTNRRRLKPWERKTIHSKTDGHCAYCGTRIELKEMCVDHMIPMNMYERYKAAGQDLENLSNLWPACRSCNHYKSTLTVEKFRAMLERGPEILARDSVAYRVAVRFGTVKPTPKKIVFYFERAVWDEERQKRERVEFG